MINTYLYHSSEPIILEPEDMDKDEWAFICKILGINGDKCEWISLKNIEGIIYNKEKQND